MDSFEVSKAIHPNSMENKTEAKSEKKKNIDDWLPITSSRNAKWWYSTFHNVTAMVGAGVLGLPFAMSQLGWGAGMVALVLSWVITLYTLWQMVEMHESVPGKRFDRYHELGQHSFGKKLGLWIVVPQQLVVQISCTIIYSVTGGKSLQKCWHLLFPGSKPVRNSYFILIFAVVQLVLAQLPNFNSLSIVSFAAATMSLSYSTISWIGALAKGRHRGIDYGLRSTTTIDIMFDVFNALGTIAFAYAGHNVVLEIQATIPSTPEKPSKRPMWIGSLLAYGVVMLCYFPTSIIGYWAFGNTIEDDILVSLEHPRWLIAVANFMVFIHVIGSYQIFAMPVFDMMETVLVKELKFTPRLRLRMIIRSLYVAITCFIGICVPFFGGLLGFFGGLVFAPTSYYLPCIMWLKIKKPSIFSFHWIASWICIILGILLMVLAPIGGMRQIILDAKSYTFFS